MVISLTLILCSIADTIVQKEKIVHQWIDTTGGQHDR
jgi:hypothetical protein